MAVGLANADQIRIRLLQRAETRAGGEQRATAALASHRRHHTSGL